MVYRRKGVFLGVKNAQCAPRFVSFCSMYGDVLLHLVDDAGVAMRVPMGRGGARGAPRAPLAARPAVSLSNLLVGRFFDRECGRAPDEPGG